MTARTERKYALNSQQLRRLSQRLSASLTIDPYCSNGTYHIRSIYFDGPKWPAIWEKISGTSPRRKYRIRFYNRRFDQPFLECKRKIGDQIIKQSRAISPKVCKDLLNQRRTKLSNVPLMRQFQVDQRTNALRPQITVDYYRMAYVHDLGQLRVTFDTDLAAGRWQDWKSIQHMPVRVIEQSNILELKYTTVHPSFIPMLLPNLSSPQLAISKYVLCHSQLATPLKGF